MENSRKIYFIIGPTASGKTALSIELGSKIKNAEIISADSRQIFKDLNLSTGKITSAEMQNIPHHMLDIINPGDYFSVVDYTDMALKIIDEVFERGNTPIIVGGTGFYIDSLLYNYNLPDVKANANLRNELESKSQDELFTILESLDFDFATRHNNLEFKNNPHRLMRAIEIATELGKIPKLNKEKRFSDEKYDIEIIQTSTPRDILKQKINLRLLERIEAGMIEEIQNIKKKYSLIFPYLESLGLEFKWISKFLQNQITKDQMIEHLQKQIYQYARRQEAWFKRYK